MFAVQTLPRLLISSVAGVYVDRWDRKKTMIVADIVRALLLLPLLLVRSQEWVWLIYLVAFLETTISQFFDPAKNAIVPALVTGQDLVRANSLNALSDSITRMIGPVLGGFTLGLFGLRGIILLDFVSYLVSALLIALIKLPAYALNQETHAQVRVRAQHLSLWHDWRRGLRLVQRSKMISSIFLVICVAMVGEGIINTLFIAYVQDVLNVGAVEWGWLITAQGFGAILGGLLIGHFGNVLQRNRVIAISALLGGVIFLTIVNFQSYPLALVLFGCLGIPVVGFYISAQTLLQETVTDRYRGRIFGAYSTSQALLLLVGTGIASLFGQLSSITFLLNMAGGSYVLAGCTAFLLLQGGIKQTEKNHEVDGT